MKRIWQIEEQVVEDPTTKLRMEFSSVHTDEVTAGNEAPGHDDVLLLRMWSQDRGRLATFRFERNGRFISAEVEPVETGQPAVMDAPPPPPPDGWPGGSDPLGLLVHKPEFE